MSDSAKMKPTPSHYIRRLIAHASNYYSIISLLLALVTLFLPLAALTKAVPMGIFAVISVLAAGFYVWKEAVEKLPKAADLMIGYRSVNFGAKSSSGGVPHSPLRFRIKLDLLNRGQELATLTELKVVTFKMNTDLLGDQPTRCRLYETNLPHGEREIHLPYRVSGRDRKYNLEYEIQVVLHEREPLKFAKRLNELQHYEIELQYSYEDITPTSHSSLLPIQGTFSDFSKNIIQGWKQNKQDNLIVEAMDI